MLDVQIFRVEDSVSPITTLIPGCYVLGRGPMLKCFDKRVSRNHAKLNINNNNVTLKSTHMNPCFHRAAGGKNITIIPQDETIFLHNGDKFALLADRYWFVIKIKEVRDESGDKSPQLTQNQPADHTINQTVCVGNETICDVDQNGNESDKDKSGGKQAEKEDMDAVQSHHKNGISPRAADGDDPITPARHEVQEQPAENIAGPSKVPLHNNITEDASQSLLHSNGITSALPPTEPVEISSDEAKMSQKRISAADDSASPKKRQKLSTNECDDSKAIDENMDVSENKDADGKDNVVHMIEIVEEESQLNLCLSSEVIIKEEEQEEQSKHIEDDNIGESSSKAAESTSKNKSRDESSECAQNEEVCEDGNSPAEEGTKENDANRNECVKEENIGEEDGTPTEEAGPKEDEESKKQDCGPSTSDGAGTSSTRARRDRCWYATSCYRKNPTHKTHFSHPGDDDYDSDPKDDRPMCAYGAACYRRNLNHRQQYKHPGPPASMPNNPNDGQRRRRAAARRVNYNDNNTPDDDYDYSDPFMDDGSSDEYVASDYSDSDTEFSPSQESEDIKALIKDAKKFTDH